MITSADQAGTILANSDADLVFMARGFLKNSYFPKEAAQQSGSEGWYQNNMNWL